MRLVAEDSAIDRLEVRLSSDPMGANGLSIRVDLPTDSKPEHVVEEYLRIRSEAEGKIACELVEVRQVSIPNWPRRVYFAVRVLTGSKDLILLLAPSGTKSWSVRAYKAD